jgi:hypothetical protein
VDFVVVFLIACSLLVDKIRVWILVELLTDDIVVFEIGFSVEFVVEFLIDEIVVFEIGPWVEFVVAAVSVWGTVSVSENFDLGKKLQIILSNSQRIFLILYYYSWTIIVAIKQNRFFFSISSIGDLKKWIDPNFRIIHKQTDFNGKIGIWFFTSSRRSICMW